MIAKYKLVFSAINKKRPLIKEAKEYILGTSTIQEVLSIITEFLQKYNTIILGRWKVNRKAYKAKILFLIVNCVSGDRVS